MKIVFRVPKDYNRIRGANIYEYKLFKKVHKKIQKAIFNCHYIFNLRDYGGFNTTEYYVQDNR